MKITRKQLRQIINEEFKLAEDITLPPGVKSVGSGRGLPKRTVGAWQSVQLLVGSLEAEMEKVGIEAENEPLMQNQKKYIMTHVDWLIDNLPAFKKELG